MKLALVLVSFSIIGLTGCAVAPTCPQGSCTLGCTGKLSLTANPTSAAADHAAAPPGNQQQFAVTEQVTFYNNTTGAICAVPTPPPVTVRPTWTNPQPLDISISSANDTTNGLAVCTEPTSGPVTLTGTAQSPQNEFGGFPAQQLTVGVQLTCK